MSPDGETKGYRKSGLWNFIFEGKDERSRLEVIALLQEFASKGITLGQLEGVERGYFDYYVALDGTEAEGSKSTLFWDPVLIGLIEQAKVGLQATFQIVTD